MVTLAQDIPHRSRLRAHHIVGIVVIVLLIVLIAARIYLPYWLKDYVNRELNNIPGYRGSVEDIDVHLYRGAYAIHGLKLNKLNAGVPVPFVAINTADLSLQWGALFRGRVVSDVHLYRPELNFAIGRNGTQQTGKEVDWNAPIKKLSPIDINLVDIQNGKIAFRDFSSNPPVNIYITNVYGTMNNLRNTEDKGEALPSTIDMHGDSIGKGRLAVKGRLNVLTKYVDMDIDARLENAALTAFNSFSNAYAGIEFKKGTIDLYSEIAIKNAAVTGYLKPLVHDLEVDPVPKHTNPLQVAWSMVASVLIEVFTNHPKDQFATKVPLAGRLDGVHTEFWPTLGGIFRNAFIQAFSKGTDNEIQFNKLGGVKVPKEEKPDAPKAEPAKTAIPKNDALVPAFGK